MLFVDETPEQLNEAQNRAAFMDTRIRIGTFNQAPVTWGDELRIGLSSIRRGSEVLEALRTSEEIETYRAADRAARANGEVIPGDWNPYRHILDTWDEERRTRATAWISQGLFDAAQSPRDLERIERALTQYQAELRDAERAPVSSFVGEMIGGLISPTTLFGLGGPGRTILSTVGRAAASNAAQSAAQEVMLHGLQPLRTVGESIMAVGSAGVLGGGVGALSHALSPRSDIHPGRPDNALGPDAVVRNEGGATIGGDLELDRAPQSVGAAATPGDTVWDRAIGGNLSANQLTRTVTDAFVGWTPVGRAPGWTSEVARRAIMGTIETSAYVRSDLDGIGRARSAEGIADDILADYQRARLGGDADFSALNRKMAELGAPAARPEDFQYAMLRSLVALPERPNTWADIETRYGPQGAEALRGAARQAADRYHALNEQMEKRLIDLGALRDDKRVATLTATLKTTRDEFDRRIAEAQKAVDELGAQIKGLEGDARVAHQRRVDEQRLAIGDIHKERQERVAEIEGQLRTEMERPKPLGREYGMAQLYDRNKIAANPDEFRDFVVRLLAKDVDEGWLFEQHGMQRGELDKLAVDEPARYRDILLQYGGDERSNAIARLQRRLDILKTVERENRLDLRATLRSLGHAERLVDSSERQVAKIAAREQEAELNVARASRDQLVAERRAIDSVLAEAGETEAQRALQDEARRVASGSSPTPGDVRAGRHATALERLDAALEGTAKFYSKRGEGEPTLRTAAYLEAEQAVLGRQRRAEERVAAGPGDIPEAPRLTRTETLARLTTRRVELDRALAQADARVNVATQRWATLSDSMRRTEDARAQRARVAEEHAAAVKAREARGAELGSGIAKTEAALQRTLKRSGVDELADEIVKAISSGRTMPTGGLDEVLTTTGRMKERRFNLTPEEREEAMQKGWLRDDVPEVLALQYRQLAGHIGLREGLSIGPRSHHRFTSYSAIRDAIHADYEGMARGKDPKEAQRLRAEAQKALADLDTVKARVTGTSDIRGDRNSWWVWGSAKARQANFIRFGPGMLLSSLGDIAATTLRHSLVKDLAPRIGEIFDTLKGRSHAELRSFVHAAEPAIFGLSKMDHVDPQDMLDGMGIGAHGTLQHAVTSRVDRAMATGTRYATMASMLGQWGRFWKTAAALSMQTKLADMVGRYDGLSKFQKADLASLGIGKAEAERMGRMFKEHGTTDAEGRFFPNADEWSNSPGGAEAARDFRMAISRDLRKAVTTPGLGDTPILMDAWYGKLLMQFQTFAFATLNRYFLPMAQRVGHLDGARDAQVLMSLSTLLAATSVSLFVKDAIAGRNPMDRWKEENLGMTSREIATRSGMLAWAAPYVDAALNTGGWGPTSRFAQNEAWTSLLGVNFAAAQQLAAMLASVSSDGAERGDWDKVRAKLVNLAPFQLWARLGQTLLTDNQNP